MKQKQNKQTNTWPFHVMLILPVLFCMVFNYIPMGGVIIAFQNYKPGLGFFGSRWVGLENFRHLAETPNSFQVLLNTLFMAISKLAVNIIFPVTLALMLNELRLRWFKRMVQTVTYLPYFLSWVVLSSILIDFLSP